MYYDYDGPLPFKASIKPAFRVDFVTGEDSKESQACIEVLPLSQLYFCDGCSRVVSRRDLTDEVDSYFCPHCLENMPSSEAMLYGMRCSKCWECPACTTTLTMTVLPAGAEQSYHLACCYCRWSSRGRLEAPQPEQLIKKIIELERASESRLRMSSLVDAFRGNAQEQQREKEMIQRLRRRSTLSRSSFLTGMAAKRGSALGGGGAGGGLGAIKERPRGPWTLEMLENKLEAESANRLELRQSPDGKPADPRTAKSEGDGPETPKAEENVSDALAEEDKKGTQKDKVPVPVLKGLTVDEILQAHEELSVPGRTRKSSLQAEMQASLEEDQQGIASLSSLPQRLQQISYGYQCTRGLQELTPPIMDAPGECHVGQIQLEAPLQNIDMWSMLPVRKPLLTKRSRRCRLASKQGVSIRMSQRNASLNVGGMQPIKELSSASDSKGRCSKVVIKPQINPCSNPPFQKNNAAVLFIPRVTAWAWRRQKPAAGDADSGFLAPGEKAELVCAMSNSLDKDVEVSIDPSAFNAEARSEQQYDGKFGRVINEQNVEVLTAPFETTVKKFVDAEAQKDDKKEDKSADKSGDAVDDADQDDPDVVCGRKNHKILIRIRFEGCEVSGEEEQSKPWVFLCNVRFRFMDPSSGDHDVGATLRFALHKADFTSEPEEQLA
jgi:hypothetical protein